MGRKLATGISRDEFLAHIVLAKFMGAYDFWHEMQQVITEAKAKQIDLPPDFLIVGGAQFLKTIADVTAQTVAGVIHITDKEKAAMVWCKDIPMPGANKGTKQ
jgi:hypothetical protein